MIRKILAVTLLAVGSVGCVFVDAAHQEKEIVEKTIPFEPGGELSLKNVNGAIDVLSWDKPEVHLVATKKVRADSPESARDRLQRIEIEIEESAGRINIVTRHPRTRGMFSSKGSVEYELMVPASIDLDLTSVNGRIKVDHVQGRVEAQTTNGKVVLAGVTGSIDAGTTNGSVEAEIVAYSGEDEMRLSTTNGSIKLAVPSDIRADLRARTTNGRIRSEFPATRKGKRSMDAELNGGGPLIRLTTTNGSIRVVESD